MNQKYIIDTDIGDDVDDAFAVMLAAKSPMDLIGITTVFRNAKQRAQMAQYLLRLIGKENIPVYAGIDKPLLQRIEYLLPPEMIEEEMKKGYYTLPQYMPEMERENIRETDAVDYIIEMAKTYGKQLTLVPIGPFTNIAMAIRKAPEIMSRIKEIRIIGGNYAEAKPEWNIACDPESAQIVFTSGIPIVAIGIDTTMRCPLSDEQLDKLHNLGSGSATLICNMIEKWTAHYSYVRPVMHDPLAVACCMDESIVTFKEMHVKVELYGEKRWCTVPCETPSLETGTFKVAVDVRPDDFFTIFDTYIFDDK
ncbi:MAG: nucleoside hydrolase [Clostridia bacterium]|nr:nucleoside hydrolase [Clostridia bacterium]